MSIGDANRLISYYGKHNVSPVHQNIDDFTGHHNRREKLYRKLGLVPVIFKNKLVLEIGPGGGYNSVIFFKWGAKVDFVEPNPKAQEELPLLLKKYKIPEDSWTLTKNIIEHYQTDKTYDIVIAEGFIPGIDNRAEVLGKIKQLVTPGGVAIVTCIDDISFFFENLKRLVAAKLIVGIKDFNSKVEILSKAFLPHLQKLKYSTRPVEDWVIDQLLNPALMGQLFSIEDCVREFGGEFTLLGSTPQMFTDYSWYKDLDYDFHQSVLDQFAQKRHLLFMTDLNENSRDPLENEKLFEAVKSLRMFSESFEQDPSEVNLRKAVSLIKEVRSAGTGLESKILKAIDEAIELAQDSELTAEKVSNAENFGSAFGRGQQYVSMAKKFNI